MNLDEDLTHIQNKCRICLKDGNINIWNYKVSLEVSQGNDDNCFYMGEPSEKSFIDIMTIFFNSQDMLNLIDEFPWLCHQCLEELKFCHIFYEKIKQGSVQLNNIYQESLNQSIEEEHLIDVLEENDVNNIADTYGIKSLEDENIQNLQENEPANEEEVAVAKHVTLDVDDSFIVTQFIPETLVSREKYSTIGAENNGEEELRHTHNLYTVNLKAVEVKNFDNFDTLESPQSLSNDISEPAIYICQYCPMAFSKSDYLKTHIQKSHVCKFCTLPFNVTEDLFNHIREVHTEHKCAICHKLLSSGTNLRHHIKRVHHIKLPAKVTLIDFVKSKSTKDDTREGDMEMLEELEPSDIDLIEEYIWKNDDM